MFLSFVNEDEQRDRATVSRIGVPLSLLLENDGHPLFMSPGEYVLIHTPLAQQTTTSSSPPSQELVLPHRPVANLDRFCDEKAASDGVLRSKCSAESGSSGSEIKEEKTPSSAGVSDENSAPKPINFAMIKGRKRAPTANEGSHTTHKKPRRPSLGKAAKVDRACLRHLSYFQSDLLPQLLASTPAEKEPIFQKMRNFVHESDYHSNLTANGITTSRILTAQGLPMIAKNRVPNMAVPYDLRLDATALVKRWKAGDIEGDILRGMRKSPKDNSFEADLDYPFQVKCNYRGSGGLINGQWFPSHAAAKIFGAHGAENGGIHSDSSGAYSIVLSSGYDNVDHGNTIIYCGTLPKAAWPSITPSTAAMRKSLEAGHQIRVLRSSCSTASGPYRPVEGLRYDGVYTITSSNLVDAAKHDYRFTLQRVAGQHPIRCQGLEARPTSVEVRKWISCKQARAGN
ncbi:hypothetical protein ACLMJK_008274 [Lecanora helva]